MITDSDGGIAGGADAGDRTSEVHEREKNEDCDDQPKNPTQVLQIVA